MVGFYYAVIKTQVLGFGRCTHYPIFTFMWPDMVNEIKESCAYQSHRATSEVWLPGSQTSEVAQPNRYAQFSFEC